MKSVAALMIFSLCLATAGYSKDIALNAQGWSILQSIPVGQDLQVNTKEGKSIKGKLDKITETGLVLAATKGSFSFQSSELAKVYVLRGRPIVKRTLIGAAIGTGVGAGVGFIAGDKKAIGGRGLPALIIGGVGFVIGGVTGLALGTSKKKELIYEANSAR